MRALPGIACAACLLAPLVASAQGARLTKHITLKEEATRELELLDGTGRYINLYYTAFEQVSPPTKATARLLDTQSGEVLQVDLPLAALVSRHKAQFLDGSPLKTNKLGRVLPDIEIQPVRYDGKALVAVLRQYRFGPKVSEGYTQLRYLLAQWDLPAGTVDRVTLIADVPRGGHLSRLALSGDGKTLWYFIDERGTSARVLHVKRFDVEAGVSKDVQKVELPLREKKAGTRNFASRDLAKLALIEYSEQEDNPPAIPYKGAIVDTATGKIVMFDAPWTPYGVDFDRAGKRMALVSNQAGTVQLLDAETGKELTKVKGGKKVQLAGFSKTDRWFYLLTSTLAGKTMDAYAVPSLKKKSLPVGKIVPGSKCFDAEGSVFAPDRSWVATWATAPKNGVCWSDKTAVDIISLD